MAIQFAAILKAMPTIITATSGIVSSIRSRRDSPPTGVEDRIRKTEEELLETAKALSSLAEEMQPMALELRAQAERNAAQEKRIKLLFGLSLASLGLAALALLVAVLR